MAWQDMITCAQSARNHGLAGYDYVLIGRPNITASRPYTQLAQDFETALTRLHAPRLPSPDRT